MVQDFIPKGTVMRVLLHNNNECAHGLGSGLAYITEFGAIWLDGHVYPVGSSAYLYEETYYLEPPQELMQHIERAIAPHLELLISESEKIDRNAIISEGTNDFMIDFFGPNARVQDTSVRYRNLSGQKHNQEAYGRKIDAITPKHDPQALHNAVLNKHLEKYRFEIGGYLHLPSNSRQSFLTPAQKKAVINYNRNGGRLGRTILEALKQ